MDLRAPFSVDKLLEIRTSRMKKMPGLTIESGIDKTLCLEPTRVDKLGLHGDEHDPTFHGGPEKAIHGYCMSHYADWRASYPERADCFVPGGFGENFVTELMNERNVCIGDIISVGSEVLLQVSLPRQPCFKLNHRFSIKNFAPKTYETSRTGWYYRVLREGTVRPGDELRLVERKCPGWTIEKVQEYLHRNKDDFDMNKQLSELEELGDEAKGQFKRRVAKALHAKGPEEPIAWKDFKILSRRQETPRIISVTLEAMSLGDGSHGTSFGSHAKVKLPNNLVRTYSIVCGDDDFEVRNKLELGIALEENSRGGSRYLHETAKVGDVLQVGKITSDIKQATMASNHLFIAGGIGITAFLEVIKGLRSINYNCQLHYAVRSSEDVPFRDRLDALGDVVILYDKAQGQRMDIKQIIKDMPWNTQIYACGPNRLMEATKAAVEECGVSPNEVHFEAFAAEISGDPFEVEVSNRDGKILQVKEEETLLEVLHREIEDVPSSCEVGNCGTCKVAVKEGRVDHRGTALTEADKSGAMRITLGRRENMAPVESANEQFVILPIRVPAAPSYPVAAIHEIRVRRNAPKIPSPNDPRSLFLKNIPVDSTEAHFRAVFASLVGAGRFETINFEDETKASLPLDPAQSVKLAGFARKRKRGDSEIGEPQADEDLVSLPSIWARNVQRTSSTAVALFADEKSVQTVLKAIGKLHKSKKYPVWGEDLLTEVPSLGPAWVSSHLHLCRSDKVVVKKAVHDFFNAYNQKEKDAAELSKRLRNEPDDDGFVTVTRGGRAAPASRNEAEEARKKMVDKDTQKKSEMKDFYRFQLRERRKQEQAALLKRFEEDKRKVMSMREKRGKFKPET
ncbi:Carnitine monooxygenase reductase subunit [Paramyrothecium foliicola]|nr:Carnitine monooxygenase reductase subunit [Paramyrothecium foliicola]